MVDYDLLHKGKEGAFLVILIENEDILLIIQDNVIPTVLEVGYVDFLREVLVLFVSGSYTLEQLIHCGLAASAAIIL